MSGGKIVVLATGGTLAGTAASAQDNLAYSAGQVGIGELLAGIPALADTALESEQLAQVDSKDMSFDLWRRLAARCQHWLQRSEVKGIVVTHGTDTLEETAFFLQEVLAPGKPVVVTGAMRPASSANADGPQNLLDAMAVAREPGARGVVAVMAGTLHGAQDVAKVHPYRPDALGSADAGVLGYVEEGRVRLLREWPSAGDASGTRLSRVLACTTWPRVEIVMSHAGARAELVQALLTQGVDGIVVAGTGNGTVHRELEAGLQEARARGVTVVRSTRCPLGRVLAHAGDTLPDAGGLSPVKARIRLMLELMR